MDDARRDEMQLRLGSIFYMYSMNHNTFNLIDRKLSSGFQSCQRLVARTRSASRLSLGLVLGGLSNQKDGADTT